MAFDLRIKVNNISVESIVSPIRIIKGDIIITWDFDVVNLIDINDSDGSIETVLALDEISYEIRIADNGFNLGTNSFIGNKANSGVVSSSNRFWKYVGGLLVRGEIYYGQIKIIDSSGRESNWGTFSIKYNLLPIVSDVYISPVTPSINDDLDLSYNFFDGDDDPDSGVLIRWYKNGIYQKNVDNLLKIDSSYLQFDNIWTADMLPFDGYEYGERVTSSAVKITKTVLEVSYATILPNNPNENDILMASFSLNDKEEENNTTIRWYINDFLISSYNNKKYIRYDLVYGDVVRYEIKPPNSSSFVSSNSVVITSSNFVIYDIKVDGMFESFEVSTISPVINWATRIPLAKEAKYTSLRIGTFYEANNVLDIVLDGNPMRYSVPSNILKRGMDYYVSIALSDSLVFENYISSHFRIKGNRWSEEVSNENGWTIETIFLIENVEDFDAAKYQIIRLQDGTRFGEVRIFNNKIGFVSDEFLYSEDIVTSGYKTLTIVGKGEDIKIYLDRKIVLDATNKFTLATSTKMIEIGNDTTKEFFVKYKYFYYTVSGAFYPGENNEYSNIKFYTYLNMPNTEIVALSGYSNYDGGYQFASNPYDSQESGSIYTIIPAKSFACSTVNRGYSPVNKINKSPDGKKIVFAHAKGISIISGYLINLYNYEINFIEADGGGNILEPSLTSTGWTLKRDTTELLAYFDSSGFNINTL